MSIPSAAVSAPETIRCVFHGIKSTPEIRGGRTLPDVDLPTISEIYLTTPMEHTRWNGNEKPTADMNVDGFSDATVGTHQIYPGSKPADSKDSMAIARPVADINQIADKPSLIDRHRNRSYLGNVALGFLAPILHPGQVPGILHRATRARAQRRTDQ
ncbi:hypothetical protein ACNQR9_08165 [Mycolicibacterium peregrinum]